MKDQYFKLIDLFDSELGRFWTRFNVFTGFQFIVIAGIAANFEKLTNQKLPGSLFILIGFLFSFFTVIVVWCSYFIMMGIVAAINQFENKDKTLVILKTYQEHTKSKLGAIVIVCVIMSICLMIFWAAFFIYFNLI